jgi:hypothetical protein
MTRAILIGPRKWKKKTTYDPTLEQVAEIWISNRLRELSRTGDLSVCSSLHLGLDTLFASIAIESDIPLVAAPAALDQHIMWDEAKKKVFESLLASATEQLQCPEEYQSGSIQDQMNRIDEWLLQDTNAKVLLLSFGRQSEKTRSRVVSLARKGSEVIRWNLKTRSWT